MNKIVNLLLVLSITVSCNRPSGNLVVDKHIGVKSQLIRGEISNKDTTAHFEIDDCSCSLTESGIIIRQQAKVSTFLGINQIAHIHNDTVNFFLETKVGYYGDSQRFKIQDSLLVLNRSSYIFGDSVEGKISVFGYAVYPTNNNQRTNIKIDGVFKCALTDSAYYQNEYEDTLTDW